MQELMITRAAATGSHLFAHAFKVDSTRAFSSPSVTKLLVVYHSRTGLAQQMSKAMERGALFVSKEMESSLQIQRRRAADATIEDVLQSDGYLFCTPENLASASGEMLEFLHRTYYHAFDDNENSLLTGRPYGLAIAAGSDGTNAAKQIERICTGWRLRPVSDTFINRNGLQQDKASILLPKVCSAEVQKRCEELGGLVAATLLL